MKRKWKIVAAVGAVILVTALAGAVHVYRETMRSIADGYALWATSEIIIAYHWRTSSWPRSWEDLKNYTEYSRHLAGHSIEDLEELVAVDFPHVSSLLLVSLDESDLSQLNDHIRLKSGRSGVWRRPQEIFDEYMSEPEAFARRWLWTTIAEPGAVGNEGHRRAD